MIINRREILGRDIVFEKSYVNLENLFRILVLASFWKYAMLLETTQANFLFSCNGNKAEEVQVIIGFKHCCQY